MTVRVMKFEDIPAVAGLLERAHQRSIYADTGTFDEIQTKQLLFRSLQRHGHKNYMGSLCLVSESNGEIAGVLLGMVDLVYPCLKELMVTDLFFVFEGEANPRDAVSMVRQLIDWGNSNPKVIEVHLGVTDAIGDWARVGSLYERMGAERCGGMWRFPVNREAKEAAG